MKKRKYDQISADVPLVLVQLLRDVVHNVSHSGLAGHVHVKKLGLLANLVRLMLEICGSAGTSRPDFRLDVVQLHALLVSHNGAVGGAGIGAEHAALVALLVKTDKTGDGSTGGREAILFLDFAFHHVISEDIVEGKGLAFLFLERVDVIHV